MDANVLTMVLSTIFGWIALTFGICDMVPQAVRVAKTKDTQSISLLMYILFVTGCIVWLVWSFGYTFQSIYNFNNGAEEFNGVSFALVIVTNLPTQILNSIGLVTSLIILIYKVKHLYCSKKYKMSERDYIQQHYHKSKVQEAK